MRKCPCGSGRDYCDCCEPIIEGVSPAGTAETLMRARYSAYVADRIGFLGESLHPDSRADYDEAATRHWAEGADWLALELRSVEDGGEGDDRGAVEFVASYREKGLIHHHHERSQFRRFEGHWYFVEGAMVKPQQETREARKVGRNDPCPCGSGKKYKKCCGC